MTVTYSSKNIAIRPQDSQTKSLQMAKEQDASPDILLIAVEFDHLNI